MPKRQTDAFSKEHVAPAPKLGTTVPVVWITGTVGSGKTTIAFAVSAILTSAGRPHALVDLDELTRCYPKPADDRFHTVLAFRNLAALWANYRDAGAERLILSAVTEDRVADLERLAAAVPGAKPVVVRLRADRDVIRSRLRRRHVDGLGLDWHLTRAPVLEAILDAAGVADFEIANDSSTETVAKKVLKAAGW
jgi:adenylylsulfate kinase